MADSEPTQRDKLFTNKLIRLSLKTLVAFANLLLEWKWPDEPVQIDVKAPRLDAAAGRPTDTPVNV